MTESIYYFPQVNIPTRAPNVECRADQYLLLTRKFPTVIEEDGGILPEAVTVRLEKKIHHALIEAQ